MLFIDDGSTDGSLSTLKQLQTKHPDSIRIISFSKNFGKSAAYEIGFKSATGDILVTLDADLQDDPSDIAKLLTFIGDYDLVCGVRVNRQDTIIRKWSSRIANRIRNWVTGEKIQDVGCALRVFKRELTHDIKFFDGFHRFIPTVLKLYQRGQHPIRIKEVPVTHHPRRFGSAKYNIRNRAFKAFYDLLGVRWLQKRQIRYEWRDLQ